MPPQRRILLAILILTASACYKPYVFSPPGRVALLETAKTVGDGAHSVGVHGGQSIVDDFRVNHLTARYRYGLSDQLEVGADANLAKYDNMPAPPSRTNPFIASARVGAKWSPEVTGDNLAFIGGLGAGTYTGGPFVSPDVGVVIAYENPYVVPFLTLSSYMSIPLDAQEVDIGASEMSDHFVTPSTTVGVLGTTGLRVPIDMGTWTLAPSAGIAVSELIDEGRGYWNRGVVFTAGLDVDL